MKLNIHTYNMTQQSFLSIYPKEMKTYIYTKTCTQMLIADLLVIAQNRKQPKGPSAGKMVKHIGTFLQWNTTEQ